MAPLEFETNLKSNAANKNYSQQEMIVKLKVEVEGLSQQAAYLEGENAALRRIALGYRLALETNQPLQTRPAGQSTHPLCFHIESDLSKPISVGRGTILNINGWCYHPEYRIKKLEIILGEDSYPVTSFGGLRKDVFHNQVPSVDRSGHSLNSGFQALLPISPVKESQLVE